jgi:peptidyl-prolyl cis-trans isomerase D
MAIIGKIREKSGLVVTIVGIGLFLFIVPLDKIMQQISGDIDNSIGLFNDSEVNSTDWNYENRLANSMTNFRYNSQNSGGDGSMSDEENDQIILNTWNQMISDTIYSIELSKLGINVSNDELNQGLLNPENPLPSSLKEEFTENNIYLKDSFALWKQYNIINQENVQVLVSYENGLKSERIRNKYSSMMKYGVLGTYEEGKRSLVEEETNAEISYIFKSYDDISDTLITIDDESRKNFFNDHRYEAMWKQQQDIRSYDYVILNIIPSQKDIKEYSEKLEDLKLDFRNATDDSVFVLDHAETPIMTASQYGPQPTGVFSRTPYKGGKFPAYIDQQIENASKGDVFGPFSNLDKVQLVKVFDSGEEEQAKVRHILINSRDGDPKQAENKKLADSILYAVRRDSSKFNILVTKYSDDQGSVANGGVYAWFPKGQMVPEFEDFSFNKRKGSSGIVKTNYGYHVIQVLGNRTGTYKNIAIVDETIRVSKETTDQYYDSIALTFYNLAKENSFDEAAEELGLSVKKSGYVPLIYPNRRTPGFYGPAELNRNMNIAKWAFNSEIGDIMEPEIVSDRQLAIAVLKEKVSQDDDRFNNLKPLMEPQIKNKLKAAYFIETNNFNPSSSLDSIANSLGLTTKISNVKYSDVNIGNNYQQLAEPKVIANIFHMNENETSTIIEGKSGLFLVKVLMKNNSTSDASSDIEPKVKSTQEELRNLIEQGYYSSLYTTFGTKDQRARNMIMN